MPELPRCDFCGFVDPVGTLTRVGGSAEEYPAMHCEVCHSLGCRELLQNPKSSQWSMYMFMHLSYAANLIRRDIARRA